MGSFTNIGAGERIARMSRQIVSELPDSEALPPALMAQLQPAFDQICNAVAVRHSDGDFNLPAIERMAAAERSVLVARVNAVIADRVQMALRAGAAEFIRLLIQAELAHHQRK